MNKYSLNKVEQIMFKNGIITVKYSDGSTLIIKGDATFEIDLINDNDQPLIDHCI